MATKLLVIDSNPAVLAITALALGDSDIQIDTLDSLAAAPSRIDELRPEVVLCAMDLSDKAPLDLCGRMRENERLRNTVFVLMVSGEITDDLRRQAADAGANDIVRKPFKSHELRTRVLRLLEEAKKTREGGYRAVVFIEDRALKALLLQVCERNNVEAVQAGGCAEALGALGEAETDAVLVETGREELPPLSPSPAAAKLVLIAGADTALPPLPSGVRVLRRPLSFAKLQSSLKGLIAFRRLSPGREPPPLTSGEQTLVAAEISAAVFQELLTQEALRNRNWQQAVEGVERQAMRVLKRLG